MIITQENKIAVSEQDLFDTEILNIKLFGENEEVGVVDFINQISFHKRFLQDSVELISKYSSEGAFPIINLSNYFDSVSVDFRCYINDESALTSRHVKNLIDMKTDMFLQENAIHEISNPNKFRDLCFLYIIYKAKERLGKDIAAVKQVCRNTDKIPVRQEEKYTGIKASIPRTIKETETRKEEIKEKDVLLRNFLTENKVNIEEYIASLGSVSVSLTSFSVRSEVLMGFIGHLEDIAGIIAEIIAETSNDVETSKLTDAFKELIEGYLNVKKINKDVLTKEFFEHCIRIIIYKIKIKETAIQVFEEEVGVDVEVEEEAVEYKPVDDFFAEEQGEIFKMPEKVILATPLYAPEEHGAVSKKKKRLFRWSVFSLVIIMLVTLGINAYIYMSDKKIAASVEAVKTEKTGMNIESNVSENIEMSL